MTFPARPWLLAVATAPVLLLTPRLAHAGCTAIETVTSTGRLVGINLKCDEPAPSASSAPTGREPEVDTEWLRRRAEAQRAADEAFAAREARAAAGDPRAQAEMGDFYYNFAPAEHHVALGWYRLAAASGHPGGLVGLGRLLLDGRVVPRDPAEAKKLFTRAAEVGGSESHYQLGRLLAEGPPSPETDALAFRLLGQAARADHNEAKAWLAGLHLQGRGTPLDPEQGLKLLEGLNGIEPWYWRGFAYEHGRGVSQDFDDAEEWYQSSALQSGGGYTGDALDRALEERDLRRIKHPLAAYRLGVFARDGHARWFRSPAEARFWFEGAAARGNADAAFDLAELHARGQGGPVDLEQARRYYEQARQGGHPRADEALAALESKDGAPPAPPAPAASDAPVRVEEQRPAPAEEPSAFHGTGPAFDEMRQTEARARSGDTASMNWLGQLYLGGNALVAMDHGKAFGWFLKAAKHGDTGGMFMTAMCLREGWGTPVDLAEATGWSRKAAETGDPYAATKLAKALEKGEDGFAVNLAEALTWYRKAADAGDGHAAFKVGDSFEHGHGTQADKAEALRWYRKAHEAGSSEATEALTRLGAL